MDTTKIRRVWIILRIGRCLEQGPGVLGSAIACVLGREISDGAMREQRLGH